MKIALISVDPISLGCTRASRNLAIHQLAAFARQSGGIWPSSGIQCFDWVLPNFGGRAGPCPETQRLAGLLLEQEYDVVGLSTKIWNFHHVRNIARLVKNARPDTVILSGGYQVEGERFPRLMLERGEPFDFLVTGEGEDPFVDLLQALRGEKTFDGCRALWFRRPDSSPVLSGPKVLADLDRLPSAFAEEVDEDFTGRLVILEASRGCPYQCHFCEWAVTTNRVFPLDRVYRELDYVLSHGGNRIMYADGTFNLDRKRRFHPMMERLIERQRHYAARFGPEYVRTGQVGLELRPELITERCAELLEEMATLFDDTFYEFGLQTTDETSGRMVGRPYDGQKWVSAVERLGPKSRSRTGISIIADLPGNTLEAVADSNRVAVRLGARTTNFCLYVLPGTELERKAELFGLEFDPYPPHRVRRWLDRTPEEIRELVAFASLCSFMANMIQPFWTELETIAPPELHLASVMLSFREWLRRNGLAEELFHHLAELSNYYGDDETSPELLAHRRWVARNVPAVFARYTASADFLDPEEINEATRAEVHRQLKAHLDLWMVNLTLTGLGCAPV